MMPGHAPLIMQKDAAGRRPSQAAPKPVNGRPGQYRNDENDDFRAIPDFLAPTSASTAAGNGLSSKDSDSMPRNFGFESSSAYYNNGPQNAANFHAAKNGSNGSGAKSGKSHSSDLGSGSKPVDEKHLDGRNFLGADLNNFDSFPGNAMGDVSEMNGPINMQLDLSNGGLDPALAFGADGDNDLLFEPMGMGF